jgi:hypothetical protein
MLQPTRSLSAVFALVVTASFTGCPGEQVASCQGPTVSHPDGKCSAYYYQADYHSGGATTQALVACDINPGKPGGNVVAFHDLSHGIGLRWIDAHTLEIAVPDGIRLDDKRSGDTYNGYPLRYLYRSLHSTEPAYLGCGVKPPAAASNNSFKPKPLRGSA